MTAAAEMTDDPQRSASVIKKLKQGAEVTLLAQWNGWAYIETKADKKAKIKKGKTATLDKKD